MSDNEEEEESDEDFDIFVDGHRLDEYNGLYYMSEMWGEQPHLMND